MARNQNYLDSQIRRVATEGLQPSQVLLMEMAHDLYAYRTADLWIAVDDRLPALPENGWEASEDVLAATIIGGKVERWERVCMSAKREWARDGILIRWIPTHWHPLPVYSIPLN